MANAVVSTAAVGEAREGREVANAVATGFWSCVARGAPDACWLWRGRVAGKGYGYHGRLRAHRLAYELTHGPIPEGLVVDHVAARGCTSRLCCNPAHLEPVTNRENLLRGSQDRMVACRTNTCLRGHSLHDARVTKKGRDCRQCHNLRAKTRREQASAIASACALGLITGLALSAILAPRAFAAVVLFLAGQGAAS